MIKMKIKNIVVLLLLQMAFTNSFAQTVLKDSTTIKYQINLNGTLDKNLVTRLILISQNRVTIENKWTKFEPVLTYRFGYVQPNGRPKADLENDLYINIENHFLPRNKIFPSVLLGYETSPNLRALKNRSLAGVGVGSFLVKKPASFLQFNLYGFYESSTFDNLEYSLSRIMPSLKGRQTFDKNKYGIIYSASFAAALNNGDNYRLRANIRPYIKIAKQFDFSVMYDIWYEGLVSGSQPKEISTFTFGLTVSNN
jgi:hypothetical protein